MGKALRIEISEVIEGKLENKEKCQLWLVETDTDMFFLLTEKNYRPFCTYFSVQLEGSQVEEIFNFFAR